ncbi:sensor histidine kinase [Nonomuraea typhae]|uniref:Sensor histidine kinase n=1 Tax=Nonomuraea typhae TaxID=2603600 RepID=A0ABW7YTV3_9ACTN
MHARLRRARIATLATLSTTVLSSLLLPGIGLFREPDPVRAALGGLGIALFALAQAGVLYAAVTPAVSPAVHRKLTWAYGAAAAASVPLVGPLAGPGWESWAWIGAAVLATSPVLGRRPVAAAVIAATVAAAAALAWWHGDLGYLTITVAVGLCIIAMNGLHLWLWTLLVEADEGRQAQARLAAAEERLRFARDVHDLLGHDLSVIALKAELAERDPARAAREAADLRRLAAAALTDLRRAVHGYQQADLRAQVTAIEQVLRSTGIRCTATLPGADLPQDAAARLAPVVREAGTNVLRHSRATWCTIEVTRDGVTIANDGAGESPADPHSTGLRGLADRLAESGGTLRTRLDGGVFTLEATLR